MKDFTFVVADLIKLPTIVGLCLVLSLVGNSLCFHLGQIDLLPGKPEHRRMLAVDYNLKSGFEDVSYGVIQYYR
jgi:hypothetical protein